VNSDEGRGRRIGFVRKIERRTYGPTTRQAKLLTATEDDLREACSSEREREEGRGKEEWVRKDSFVVAS
jgi:hypothetical protein